MPTHAPLARIQIDCSNGQSSQPSASMFSGLPIGSNNGTNSSAVTTMHQLAMRKEAATGAERQALLSGDDEHADMRPHTCMSKMHRWAPCVLYISCAMTLIIVLVFLVLFYMQVNTAVQSIDKAVSLKSSAVNMIRNADTILNKSAEITGLVNQLGGLSLNAAMFSQPYLTRVLNTTTNTIEDMHRLIERPVIQLNGRRKRRR